MLCTDSVFLRWTRQRRDDVIADSKSHSLVAGGPSSLPAFVTDGLRNPPHERRAVQARPSHQPWCLSHPAGPVSLTCLLPRALCFSGGSQEGPGPHGEGCPLSGYRFLREAPLRLRRGQWRRYVTGVPPSPHGDNVLPFLFFVFVLKALLPQADSRGVLWSSEGKQKTRARTGAIKTCHFTKIQCGFVGKDCKGKGKRQY